MTVLGRIRTGADDAGFCSRASGARKKLAGYTHFVRLTDDEKRDIAAAASAVLPRGSRVSLFGSRTDDSKRGGDVDLLVELPAITAADDLHRLRGLLTVQLYRRMGERHIDIVMTDLCTADDRLIVSEARRQALELIRT